MYKQHWIILSVLTKGIYSCRAILMLTGRVIWTTENQLLDIYLHWLVVLYLGEADRKSTRLNPSHSGESRMPSSA